jgi:hypothetical protein
MERIEMANAHRSLFALADELKEAEIPFFLVPDAKPDLYRIGVRQKFRKRVLQQLANSDRGWKITVDFHARNVPKPTLEGPGLTTQLRRYNAESSPTLVFTDPDGGSECALDFWFRDRGDLVTRAPNRLGSRFEVATLKRARIKIGARGFRTWTVFRDLSHVEQPRFAIDVVFDLLGQHQQALDLLRFALRSVADNATFVRRYHVLAAGEEPSWLDTTQRDLIWHRLPQGTIANQAASVAAGIPEVADHFVLLPPSTLLAGTVTSVFAFFSNGVIRYSVDAARLPDETDEAGRAELRVREALEREHGRQIVRPVFVGFAALNKSVVRDTEDRFRELASDSGLPSQAFTALCLRNGFLTGRAIDESPMRFAVVDLALGNIGSRVRDALTQNDVVALEPAMAHDLPEQLEPVLERAFPRPSNHEA